MFVTPQECRQIPFAEIALGMKASFQFVITEEEHQCFSALTGDRNPLHEDRDYCHGTAFSRPICHGLQVAALFSTLSGTLLPGLGSLTLSHDLQFKKPVYPGETLTVCGTVMQKFEVSSILELKLEVFGPDGNLCVRGKKLVQAREAVWRNR